MEFFPVIHSAQLFAGISEEEISDMLSCLGAKIQHFPKGSFLLRAGGEVEEIGLVLAGSVLLMQEDVWGNRNILSKVGPGQAFAVAAACTPGAVLPVSAAAETPVAVLRLQAKQVMAPCGTACANHSRFLQNLLGELAGKNLHLSEKLTHMGQRTTRAKLMSYLSAQAQKLGRNEFTIPLSRQQLADYLAVERSGLCVELGKMRKEGLLEFHKNHFVLKT